MGVRIAICEVGDEFCPVFRLAELPFDYAFVDDYATNSLDREDCERVFCFLFGVFRRGRIAENIRAHGNGRGRVEVGERRIVPRLPLADFKKNEIDAVFFCGGNIKSPLP